MEFGLKDQSAIITGGSRGIGAAIALRLASEGCNVAINHLRDDSEAERVVSQIKAMGQKGLAFDLDVCEHIGATSMVKKVVETFGSLDILVSNAGINWDGVIWKMPEEQFDKVINVNLKGCFNYNQAAARIFKEQKHGKIVNIASINGMRGKFGQTNYAAAKGGEIALTKALARELGKYNVNVNAVAPGMVMTEMARSIPPEFINQAVDETVLGRIATPEDIADLVSFLVSDRARHITGEVIKVDGGQYI